jgi:hypothetical protein
MSGTGSPNQNPDCPNPTDQTICRVTVTSQIQEPFIPWSPIYDGHGQMTNADPNTFVNVFSCSVCLIDWEVTNTAGTPPVKRVLKHREPK